MSKIKTPECCKKPMELKAVSSETRCANSYAYFQCKKCGEIEKQWNS